MTRSLVVGAAVIRAGRVLAARRSDTAGNWEFPGGKVEPGETAEQALRRELAEELGLPVDVGAELGRVPLSEYRDLAVFACRPTGEPQAGPDHDELRWLPADGLDSVDWLPADRVLLPAVAAHLRAAVGRTA